MLHNKAPTGRSAPQCAPEMSRGSPLGSVFPKWMNTILFLFIVGIITTENDDLGEHTV